MVSAALSAIRIPGPRTISMVTRLAASKTRWLTSSVVLLNASPIPTRKMLWVLFYRKFNEYGGLKNYKAPEF